jgi:hypothetical protein
MSGRRSDNTLSRANDIGSLCLALRVLRIAARAMSLPRQVLPGRFYMLTRRCTQRQFLLRPDNDTNSAFVYCVAEATQRFTRQYERQRM